jgi:hypothetical protein
MAHGWFTCEDGSPDVAAIAATAAQVRRAHMLACVLRGHGLHTAKKRPIQALLPCGDCQQTSHAAACLRMPPSQGSSAAAGRYRAAQKLHNIILCSVQVTT